MCVCAPPRTPPEGVVIYARPEWSDFAALRNFFEDRGVVYDYENVVQQPAALQHMQRLSGQTEQAVTAIGSAVFIGYVPNEIERLLPPA